MNYLSTDEQNLGYKQDLVRSNGNLGETSDSAKSLLSSNQFLFPPNETMIPTKKEASLSINMYILKTFHDFNDHDNKDA